jgi:LysM repeat protein
MRNFKALALAGISLLFFQMPAQAQFQKVETKKGEKYIIHKVQDKETVYSIARTYKVTPKELIGLNPEIGKVLKKGVLIDVPYTDANKEEFGPKTLKEPAAEAVEFEEVKYKVQKGDFLNKIAKQNGVDVDELKKWNDLEGDKISPGQELIVGIRSKSKKKNNENKNSTVLADNSIKNPNKTTSKLPIKNVYRESNEQEFKEIEHIVKEKETLFSISRQYQVKPDEIKEWNDMDDNVVKVDKKLKIRVPNTLNQDENLANPKVDDNNLKASNTNEEEENETESNNDPQAALINYKVQEGESIYDLRQRFNVSSTEIKFWNGMDPNDDRLTAGQNLKLYIPKKVNHVVQPSETPASVAIMHNVNVRQIEIWNNIPKNQISKNFQVGKNFVIYEPTGPTPTKEFRDKGHSVANNTNPTNNNLKANNNNTNPATYQTHTVAQGEALYDISQKYGITVAELKDWNGIPNTYYHVAPGTQLRIYRANNTNNNPQANNNLNTNNTNQNPNRNTNNTNPNRNTNNTNPNRNTNNTNPSRGNNNNNANPNTNPAFNNNTNPFESGKVYEYSTTSTSSDPFDQLNNSTKTPVNNNSTNNTTPNTNTNPNDNNFRGINPDNPPQVTDYNNTNTSRFLNSNNNNPNTGNVNPNPSSSGSEEIKEEGFAAVMQDIPSPKPYVALHRSAPTGTLIIIKNPNTQKTIVVDVVGSLDMSQAQNGVVIQLTPAVMERLGSGGNRMIPVEISYRLRPSNR